MADRDHKRHRLNSALQTALGRPVETLLGKSPNEHEPGGKLALLQQRLTDVIASGSVQELGFSFTDPSGSERHHHIRIIPERGRHNEVIGALALGRDITEWRNAEQRLHASEQAFRAVVEHSPDYIARSRRRCRFSLGLGGGFWRRGGRIWCGDRW